MRVFSASLATETNTFGPMPTSVESFSERSYFHAGEHPNSMQMFSGPLWAARQIGSEKGWTLLEGMVAAAVPNGITTRSAYESLRDELLEDLRRAAPVDIVLLGLHGAMVASGYDDCEGDLLEKVRGIVGRDTVVGATLDPHTHLSQRMINHSDLLVWWKEYPHTDILERAVDLVNLCAATRRGLIAPQASVVDTGMIVLLHTTRAPASLFVERAKLLEQRDEVLSVSIVHGFPWGDTPDMGTKVVVYTDANKDSTGAIGQALAQSFADDLWAAREQFGQPQPDIDSALNEALSTDGTVVLADGADNAGAGASSDSTFILRRLIERKIPNACVGPIWDPVAVRLAFAAGLGATLPVRVGGKIGPLSGEPIDALWTVRALKPDLVMKGLCGTPAKLGDCALLLFEGIEVVLTTIRCQAFGLDMFTQLDCDPSKRQLVVVKSSQHFYAAFAPISSKVIYVSAPGVATNNIATLPFKKVARPKWPLDSY